MKRNAFFSAKNIAYLAVLTALVIVLQAVGGSITIGTVSFNFTLIPIVLGAVLLGARAGAFLGFACGVVVLVQVITGAGFYAVVWTYSPVVTVFTCLLKTTVAGFVSGILYDLIKGKSRLGAMFVASAVVPVINTALFILGCLCMSGSISIFAGQLGGDYANMNVLVFVLVVLVTFNFFIEFAVNVILSPALCRITETVEKQIRGKRASKNGNAEGAGQKESTNQANS